LVIIETRLQRHREDFTVEYDHIRDTLLITDEQNGNRTSFAFEYLLDKLLQISLFETDYEKMEAI